MSNHSSHSKEPPTLPVIVDEAGDTPGWVPAVGGVILLLVVAVVALRGAGIAPFAAHEASAPAEEAPAAAP